MILSPHDALTRPAHTLNAHRHVEVIAQHQVNAPLTVFIKGIISENSCYFIVGH